MILLRSVVLQLIGGSLVLLAFGGCGGETFEGSGTGAMAGTDGAGGQNGNAGNGGSGNAGSGSGGNAGNGGAGNGGNGGGGNGGAGSGGAGNAGSGGAGSGGTAGAGGSGGLPPEWLTCGDTSDCMVRETTCCQGCGPQELSRAIAFNRRYADDVTQRLCGPIPQPCPAAACVLAPAYVLPFCIEGRCQAIDIRNDKLTSCGTEAECRVRWGTQCCEPCGTPPLNMLVAVNSQVNYDQTVCGSGTGCPDCVVGPYPTNAKPLCGTDHHCNVGFLR